MPMLQAGVGPAGWEQHARRFHELGQLSSMNRNTPLDKAASQYALSGVSCYLCIIGIDAKEVSCFFVSPEMSQTSGTMSAYEKRFQDCVLLRLRPVLRY